MYLGPLFIEIWTLWLYQRKKKDGTEEFYAIHTRTYYIVHTYKAFQNDAKRKQINPVFLLGDSSKINWIPWAWILLSL